MENGTSRVLIIDTAWLGDVVFSTALVRAVRDRWRDSEIHFLTAPRGEPIVRNHPDLGRVWIFDKHGKDRSLGSAFKLANELNQCDFDLVLCAHPSFRSRLICSRLSAPIRVGYRGFGGSRAFTHTIENSLSTEPDHVERRINLLRAVEAVAQTPSLCMGLTADELESARATLDQTSLAASPLLGLIPGSARLTKQWSMEHFATLARMWRSKTGGKSLVFLGPSEKPMRPFFEREGDMVQVIETGLRSCAALLQLCQCAVGNDTGLSFVAIAAGCPKVHVLYGCTQVNYRFPTPHRALPAGVPCCLPRTGHGEARCKWTNGAPWCMGQIRADDVFEQLLLIT